MILGFAHRWPIKQTMGFEAAYHPNLRLTLRAKVDLLGAAGGKAMCVWMFDKRTRGLVGEAYGVDVREAIKDLEEEGSEDLRPFVRRGSPKTLYCYSTTIIPELQRRGLGKILKVYFLGMASEHYSVVVGHARQGGSCRLNEIFGAEFGAVHSNWYGVGEPYHFYTMDLNP